MHQQQLTHDASGVACLRVARNPSFTAQCCNIISMNDRKTVMIPFLS